jgi:hypothetical protein
VVEPPLLELPVAPLDALVVVLPLELELVVVALVLVVVAPELLLVLVGPVVFFPPVPVVPPPLPFDAEEPHAATPATMRIEVPRMRREVMPRTIDEKQRPGSC